MRLENLSGVLFDFGLLTRAVAGLFNAPVPSPGKSACGRVRFKDGTLPPTKNGRQAFGLPPARD